MKFFWFPALLFILLPQDIYSQTLSIQTINSGGGAAGFLQEDISIEWSAGEAFTNLHVNGDYIFSEGFQQFQVDDALTFVQHIELGQVSIFPNPFSDHIDIRKPLGLVKSLGQLTLDLYSSSGSHILKNIVLGEDKTLDTSLLNPGVYFLTVKDRDSVVQIEKLIKVR